MEDEGKSKPVSEIPAVLPLLPVRDLVVFPYMIVPLRVSRPLSMDAIQRAMDTDQRLCFLTAQRDSAAEEPAADALHITGTIGMVMRVRKLSEGGLKVLVQGLCRARIVRFVAEKPSYRVRIERIEDSPATASLELEALVRSVRDNLEKLGELGKETPPEIGMVLQTVEDPGRIADLVAGNLSLKVGDAQALLEQEDPVERLQRVNRELEKEVGVLELQTRIQSRAKEEMSKSQRDYFLREQMRQIRTELGDPDGGRDEVDELRAKVEAAGMPDEARAEADKQIRRLTQMHADSAEAAVARAYLEWLIDVPWKAVSDDRLDLVPARRILDEDHYDLESVKERILDYLAVVKLRGGAKGPILCFLGPPGVGKTSLGRSIARCMGRKFVRVSLGGVRDEAEIRGHRRTYVGALPGRIIQGMKQAGTRNPVFLFDEIDKVGSDYRGDPSAALLEVLDPEQNHAFRDHYLGVSYDLSRVLFIATANLPDSIPAALRDRMEMLRLTGYSEHEKMAIAERFIVPKQVAEAGLTPKDVILSRPLLRRIIGEYTREAGLRELERVVAQVARKVARRLVEQPAGRRGRPARARQVAVSELAKLLGPPRYLESDRRKEDEVGTANGLAWTPYGGEVLHVEAQAMAGRGSLILTGQLGDVMKESAQAALSFARAQALAVGVRGEFYADREIHIHVPAGAIPKDGPSAGVTMACALVSMASRVPVRHDVAMTGELTLRGHVLPVGGLKEKLLAALRAGMSTVVIPAGNASELSEIPEHVRTKLEIIPVRTMTEVLQAALLRPPGVRRPASAPAPAVSSPALRGRSASSSGRGTA